MILLRVPFTASCSINPNSEMFKCFSWAPPQLKHRTGLQSGHGVSVSIVRSSGIATGLEASSTDANLFVAVDLPLLTKEFLKYLCQRLENSSSPLLASKIGSDFPLTIGMWRPMLPEIKHRLQAGQLAIIVAPRKLRRDAKGAGRIRLPRDIFTRNFF